MDLVLYSEGHIVERSPTFCLAVKDNRMDISYSFKLKDESGELVLPSLFGGTEMVHLLPMIKTIKIKLDMNLLDFIFSPARDYMNQILEQLIASCPRHSYTFFDRGLYVHSSYQFRSESRTYSGKFIAKSRVSALSDDHSLTYGFMEGVTVSQQMLGILNSSFGKLRSITFEMCDFVPDEFSNFTLYLTGLQHLEHFELDIAFLHFKNNQHIFFIIEYDPKSNNSVVLKKRQHYTTNLMQKQQQSWLIQHTSIFILIIVSTP